MTDIKIVTCGESCEMHERFTADDIREIRNANGVDPVSARGPFWRLSDEASRKPSEDRTAGRRPQGRDPFSVSQCLPKKPSTQ